MTTTPEPQEEAGEMSVTEWVTLSLRVLLGAWFLYSGGVKLWGSGLDDFVQAVSNYRFPWLPDAWIAPAAYLLPWVEVCAGLCLMLGCWQRGAILVIAGMVITFMIFVGWAWQQQLDISCGCRDNDEPIRYWFKAVELPGYLAVLGWLWWKGQKVPAIWAGLSQKKQNMA